MECWVPLLLAEANAMGPHQVWAHVQSAQRNVRSKDPGHCKEFGVSRSGSLAVPTAKTRVAWLPSIHPLRCMGACE